MRKISWLLSVVMLWLLPRYALGQAPLLPLEAGDETRLWLDGQPMLNTVVSTHADSIVVLDGEGTTWMISTGDGLLFRIASRSGIGVPQVYPLTRLEVNGGRHPYGPGKGMLIGTGVGAVSGALLALFATGTRTERTPGVDTAAEAWAGAFIMGAAVVGGVVGGTTGRILGRRIVTRWEPVLPAENGSRR